MKLAIIGSRSITRADVANCIPAEWRATVTEIISGGAAGVDELAAEYARANGLKLTVFRPDYRKWKRKAPLMRNAQIVWAADGVLAIHDGISKGTLHAISNARRAGKPVHVVTLKNEVLTCV